MQLHPAFLFLLAAAVLLPGSAFPMAEEPAEPAVISRTFDVLASHKTFAVFAGAQEQPCRFLTSLCPHQCGHAAQIAKFDIAEYIEHSKPGQYGEEKQRAHYLRLSGGRGGEDAATPEQAAFVATLQVGDRVRLDWDHIYVEKKWEGGGSAKFPERPVKLLERAA
jgi:hypothetical protein